ncbi:agamous-like MADS-box protein AGL19 [Rosa sericea]
MPKTANPGRRHATLLKKANELSILCDAEVAVIAFSPDGELHEYSSTSMEHTLERYKNRTGLVLPSRVESPAPEEHRHEPAKQELQERHKALCLEKLRRMGKELDGLSSEALSTLLEQQTKGLLAVQSKKVELLEEKLQRSRSREEQAMHENGLLEEKLVRSRSREEQTMHENESLRRRIGGFLMRQNYKRHILPCHPANYLDRNYGNRMGFCTSSRAAVSVSNRPSEGPMDHLDMTTLRLWPS